MSPSLRRTFLAILIGALVALAIPGLAAAQESRAETRNDAFYVRIGGVTEGPQHTLKSGYELGAGYDWSAGDGLSLGMGLAFADEAASSDSQAHTTSLEGHGRWLLTKARVRPLFELGVGYYWFDGHWSGLIGGRNTWAAPGAWFGLGAEAAITAGLSVRLGIAYHLVAQSITVSGGNLEDYFATGLTLAYGPRR